MLQAALERGHDAWALQGTVLDAAVHLAACHVAAGRGQDALDGARSTRSERAGPEAARPGAHRSRWSRSQALVALGDAAGRREVAGRRDRPRHVGWTCSYELGCLLLLDDDDLERARRVGPSSTRWVCSRLSSAS